MWLGAGVSAMCLFLASPKKRESCTIFGAYVPGKDAFYWKSAKRGNSSVFKSFLYQLKAHAKEKILAVILDNATLHKSQIVRNFLESNQKIKLFFLPPYSPEYNPTNKSGDGANRWFMLLKQLMAVLKNC